MDIQEFDFENDVKIDPEVLDVEALRQADTFYRYARAAAEAHTIADQKKLAWETLGSTLSMRVREHPEKYGLVKTTDNSVMCVVTSRDSYLQAAHEYYLAKETAKILDGAVAALEQRKAMLELLGRLHGQQYFAGPTVPHDLLALWAAHRDGTRERLNEKQRAGTHRRVKRGGA